MKKNISMLRSLNLSLALNCTGQTLSLSLSQELPRTISDTKYLITAESNMSEYI